MDNLSDHESHVEEKKSEVVKKVDKPNFAAFMDDFDAE